MSDKIEAQGKTVKDAVNEALLRMGARQDEVKITVIEEPKSGFLGLGGRQAKVLVEKKPGGRSGGRRDFREKEDNYSPHSLSDGKSGGGRSRGRRGGRSGGAGGRPDGETTENRDRQESRGRSRGRRGGARPEGQDRNQDRKQDRKQEQPRERQEARGDSRREGGRSEGQDQPAGRSRRRGRRSQGQNQNQNQNQSQDRPVAREDGPRQEARNETEGRQESRGGRSRGRRGGRGRGRGENRSEARPETRNDAPRAEAEVNGNHHDNGPEKQLTEVTAREARNSRPGRRGRRSGGRPEPRPAAAEVSYDTQPPQVESAPRTRLPRQEDIPDVAIISAVKADAYAAPVRDVPADAVGPMLEEMANGVLARGGFPCRTNVTPDDYYQVRVTTDDASAGMLIGRHGATIDAVEHLIDRMAGMAAGDRVRLNLDINNYRRRRSEVLHERVTEAVAKVNEGGRPFHMEPMCARERRIVHLAAENEPSVKTFTMSGSGEKHVVIAPADEPRVENDSEEPVIAAVENDVDVAVEKTEALPELDDYTEVVETEDVPGEPEDFGEIEYKNPPPTES